MKDIGKELRKLVDAVATSLGCMVIAVTVFFAIAVVMRAIYCCPPEERGEGPSRGGSRGIPAHLIANPVHRWHPLNVHRK